MGCYIRRNKRFIKRFIISKYNKRLIAKEALEHELFKIENKKSTVMTYNIKHRQLNKLIDILMKYRSDNILWYAVIVLLVHNISKLNQSHNAIKLYNQIDKNGDEKISKEKLSDGLYSEHLAKSLYKK